MLELACDMFYHDVLAHDYALSAYDKTAARPFDPVFPVTLGDEYFPHHYIEHELQFR